MPKRRESITNIEFYWLEKRCQDTLRPKARDRGNCQILNIFDIIDL